MRALSFAHDAAVEAVTQQVTDFLSAVDSFDDIQLLAPSRCHGWSVLDVVVHVRMGLQEMAVATTSHSGGAPDHDAASYWTSHPDDRDVDPVPHILWLRRIASAYARPAAAVVHLQQAAVAASAAVAAMNAGVVGFQGKRMRSGDFLGTWVVELAVHELDLGVTADAPSGVTWARRTLEAVAGAELPAALDDRSAVLVGLGRIPPPASVQLVPAFPVSL